MGKVKVPSRYWVDPDRKGCHSLYHREVCCWLRGASYENHTTALRGTGL